MDEGQAFCEPCDLHLVGAHGAGRRWAAYALSLPERSLRVLVGSLAGAIKGVSDLALPLSVRRTKTYQVLLNKNLRYLIEEVGSVTGVFPDEAGVRSRYVARKFVGNFVEIAGILTLHASPVWILALVSDLSGGTRIFIRELAEEFKREGLLDPSARVDTTSQLLDGLQSVAARMADHIDTPPLSVEELRETLSYIRQDTQAFRLGTVVSNEEMTSLMEEMQEVARKEERTLFEISTAMALEAVNRLHRSRRRAATGMRVGMALLDRSIIQYYRAALQAMTREGYYRYLARNARPYLRAVSRNFTWRRATWTERYFLGRAWERILVVPHPIRRIWRRAKP